MQRRLGAHRRLRGIEGFARFAWDLNAIVLRGMFKRTGRSCAPSRLAVRGTQMPQFSGKLFIRDCFEEFEFLRGEFGLTRRTTRRDANTPRVYYIGKKLRWRSP